MEGLRRRAKYTGDEVPKEIQLRNQVTQEIWDEKSDAFKEDLALQLERDHETAIRGWKASLADSPTRTPEEIAAYVYLELSADAER